MQPQNPEFRQRALKIFKALSDATRYEMVRMLLEKEEISCGEFAQRFDLSPSALSYHYRVLSEAGLLTGRRAGQHMWYRLNREVLETFLPGFAAAHGRVKEEVG